MAVSYKARRRAYVFMIWLWLLIPFLLLWGNQSLHKRKIMRAQVMRYLEVQARREQEGLPTIPIESYFRNRYRQSPAISSSLTATMSGSPAYETARFKGEQLLNQLSHGSNIPSLYFDSNDFFKYGFTVISNPGHKGDYATELTADNPLWEAMGADTELFERLEVRNEGTGAEFLQFLNAKRGLLVAKHNQGVQVNHQLSKWSDIAFLMWKVHCENFKTSISALKMVLRHPVANWKTVDIIVEVMERLKLEKTTYPGSRVPMSMGEGKALLGTPNGKGIARLLMDHQDTFPREQFTVQSVDILWLFEELPSLLFHIGPPGVAP